MTPMYAGFAIAVAESVAAPASGCTSDNYGYIFIFSVPANTQSFFVKEHLSIWILCLQR